MKIYTRTGDSGMTSLFSGGRVPKHHLRVDAYGTVDELNAALGLARALGPTMETERLIARVQTQLFHLGADLATPEGARSARVVRVQPETVAWMEQQIDLMTAELAPLTQFILPGGTPAAAQIHVARTICRRAERMTALLAGQESTGEHVLPYLNRLSDFLFTLARLENARSGHGDEKWAVDADI